MSKARRDWYVAPDSGTLFLSLEVEVNGKKLRSTTAIPDSSMRYSAAPPPKYLERELRRHLMRSVEDELLGPEA